MTPVPFAEALLALATMEGGPEHPADVLDQDEFLLCELGEHDETVEHGAHLWSADTPDDRELWLLWTGSGTHRLYRLDTLPVCPARLRNFVTYTVTVCAYFDHHPGPHSFSVTDPLGELITRHDHDHHGHDHREAQRPAPEDDSTGTRTTSPDNDPTGEGDS
ncbi:hypothetical protein ACF1D2_33335 [Streptomyces bacillaris]|uniref:hypothetical protein n=1 Tax=Streptomyces bacillaris TaxID=68179 RepID=UPI0036FAA182